MKNILFICESYLHKPSPNGICVQRVAECIASENCRVCVVTFFNAVQQPAYEKHNGVEIFRVLPGRIMRTLYQCEDNPDAKQMRKTKLTLSISHVNGMLHAFCYPLLSYKQVNNLYQKAKELMSAEHFQYVVTVYHKIDSVLAGIRLKHIFKDTRLILYTLDAISGGWVPDILHSRKIPMRSLKRWERYFFRNIDVMFAMESHRAYYERNAEYQKYSSKIQYLDIPLLTENTCKKEMHDDDTVDIVYTGSMSKDTANPLYFISLLHHLPNVRFHIYGRIQEEILPTVTSDALFGTRILVHGTVSHDEILKIQKNADVLLNFGNANSNMIPCKIFEYMSTGNKIISFTHSESDSSLPYINAYINGLVVTEDDSAVDENVNKIVDFINNPPCPVTKEELEQTYRKNTPEYFADMLEQI